MAHQNKRHRSGELLFGHWNWCNSPRFVQTADFLQVQLTRGLPQVSVEIALICEMLKSNSTPVRAVAMWNGLLMRFPALISFFLLCCGLASGCWEDVTTQVAATVLSVKGTVVFGMAEQNNF